jgi:hypothetical protein
LPKKWAQASLGRHPLQSSQDGFLQRIILVRSDKAFLELLNKTLWI